ncbi:hypothetical protein [Enterobacter sp. 168J2]|uniref:hypothetical protein n=1 Tax=Enterobacter sp. 168J2 TaxID=3077758 RepID=UPI002A83308F|nr:hypothetical protein [Enterobacter sp. 168J2]
MKALVIFGSTARNERSFDSDIDMLGVYDKEKILSVSKESVSLFLYPETTLREKMVSGDLFALHLVKESIPIYGSEIIKDIYSTFKYKESYTVEINTALKVSTEILSIYDKLRQHKSANKKIAWCLRTVIISISAQDRTPVFSKQKLSEYIKVTGFDSREILILINVKSISKKLPSRIINRISCLFNELYIYSDFHNYSYKQDVLYQMLHDIDSNNHSINY